MAGFKRYEGSDNGGRYVEFYRDHGDSYQVQRWYHYRDPCTGEHVKPPFKPDPAAWVSPPTEGSDRTAHTGCERRKNEQR